MKTRIVTRAIIYKNNKILLSRNQGYDFWYPGGGEWEPEEDLLQCATREAFEETGHKIKVLDLMYVQEFYISKEERNLELFFLAEPLSASTTDHTHEDMDKGGHVQVEENRWFGEEEMKTVKVYPEFIRERFWQNIRNIDKSRKIFFKNYQVE